MNHIALLGSSMLLTDLIVREISWEATALIVNVPFVVSNTCRWRMPHCLESGYAYHGDHFVC